MNITNEPRIYSAQEIAIDVVRKLEIQSFENTLISKFPNLADKVYMLVNNIREMITTEKYDINTLFNGIESKVVDTSFKFQAQNVFEDYLIYLNKEPKESTNVMAELKTAIDDVNYSEFKYFKDIFSGHTSEFQLLVNNLRKMSTKKKFDIRTLFNGIESKVTNTDFKLQAEKGFKKYLTNIKIPRRNKTVMTQLETAIGTGSYQAFANVINKYWKPHPSMLEIFAQDYCKGDVFKEHRKYT